MSCNQLFNFSDNTYSAILNPSFNSLDIINDISVGGDIDVTGSITLSNLIIQSDNNNTFPNQITIKGQTDPTGKIDIGFDTTNSIGSIVSQIDGVIAPLNLNINFNGSNLGIVNCGEFHVDEILGYTSNNILNIANFSLNSSTISTLNNSSLLLKSSGNNNYVEIEQIRVNSSNTDSTITSYTTNANLNLTSNGSGNLKLLSDTLLSTSKKLKFKNVSDDQFNIRFQTDGLNYEALPIIIGDPSVSGFSESFAVSYYPNNDSNNTMKNIMSVTASVGSEGVFLNNISTIDDTLDLNINVQNNKNFVVDCGSGDIYFQGSFTGKSGAINMNDDCNLKLGQAYYIDNVKVLDMNNVLLYNGPNYTNLYRAGGSDYSQLLQNRTGTISLAVNNFIQSNIFNGTVVLSGAGTTQVDRVIYPGSSKCNLVSIVVNYIGGIGSNTTVNINDITNSTTIASFVCPSTSGSIGFQDLGTLSNLPAGYANFAITFNVVGPNSSTYYGFNLQYN